MLSLPRIIGGDIMIHGNAVSAGCLAVGDEAAEDLFIPAADTGLPHVTVIISPVDIRKDDFSLSEPAWTAELYAQIRAALRPLPLPLVPHPAPAAAVCALNGEKCRNKPGRTSDQAMLPGP